MKSIVKRRLWHPDAELGQRTLGIVEDIGSAIVSGEYPSGEILPVEADLAQKYQASRSVLREAVKILSAKGLVTARRRKGTSVTPKTSWDLLDADVLRWILMGDFSLPLLVEFTDIRLGIEPQAAAGAAERADPVALAAIRVAFTRMHAALRGDDDPLDSDISFHLAILAASGNRFINRLKHLIEAALLFSIRYTDDQTRTADIKLARHERVLLAIESGDPEAAAAASRDLLIAARAVMVKGLTRG
ncbi:FadR/GntR family transcriptional regulator [Niveispirillum fermenti]|uniref:FadR/GntR family transcriptional regulator n=1 Tax=Niveispirillum fermenti TaxID=1233113 RepID=UPI003A8C2F0A